MAESQHVPLPTVGAIAARIGVNIHQVEYVIRTRGIQPIGWAGNARVFSETDVARIASELRRIEHDADGVAEGCSHE